MAKGKAASHHTDRPGRSDGCDELKFIRSFTKGDRVTPAGTAET